MPTSQDLHPDALRVSDDEREAAVLALRDHAAAGRLELDELGERLERAYAARTRADLAAVTRDLPAAEPVAPTASDASARRELRGHVAAFVLVNLLLIAIWAASGAGYFWPVWPLLGWGIGIASHASETLFGARVALRGPCGRRRPGRAAAS